MGVYTFVNHMDNFLDPANKAKMETMGKNYEKRRDDWLNKLIASVALTILASCIVPLPFVLIGAAMTGVSYNYYRTYDNLKEFTDLPTKGRNLGGIGAYEPNEIKKMILKGTFLFETIVSVKSKENGLNISIKDPLF